MHSVSKASTGPSIAVYAAPEWPGKYLSHQLAKSGLNLTAVIFGRDPLEHVPFRIDNFRRAISKVGVRPAFEALIGFPRGFRHACNRLLSRELSPELEDLTNLGVPVHRVDDYVCSRAHELLRKFAPDEIVICGTSILPESILVIDRLCAPNIHTSVLPHYRGDGSVFWGQLFRDFEKIGYTIHKAVPQVDAGPYLYRQSVPVKNVDTTESLT
jgi:hypothetical protein